MQTPSFDPGLTQRYDGSLRLVWKDRQGKTLSTLGEAKGVAIEPVLSPNGKRLAVEMVDALANSTSNIWIYDTERGVPTRFTFDAATDSDPGLVAGRQHHLLLFNTVGTAAGLI